MDFGDESIYNLIPKEPTVEERATRYKSKFNANQEIKRGSAKCAHRTMGPAKVDTRPPEQFLRKHEKEPKIPRQSNEFRYPDERKRKPPVPKHDEKPLMGLSTKKDFILENAVESINAIPKCPKRIYVDTRKGDKQFLDPSGLQPIFLNKKEYGRTPEYLKRIKSELEHNQEQMEAYFKSIENHNNMRKVTEEERETLIKGLKNKWDSLYKDYLRLPMVVDTPPKKMLKERLEMELGQLEKDVQLLETYKDIYVAE